jgi:prepilin-type N-terminal cleavage/methylation domain-containing protein
MKNKTSQSGFTLIELIAVMVILGILAAVIIPRISTITSGAYESNVRNMYGLIKNEVTAVATKAAMTGNFLETYPEPAAVYDGSPVEATMTAVDYYIATWVEDYDPDQWSSFVKLNLYPNTTNDAGGVGDDAHDDNTNVVLFMYHPHGKPDVITWTEAGGAALLDGATGTSVNKEDIYWIYYAPRTSLQGKAKGRELDSYVMSAWKNDDLDFDFDGLMTAAGGVTDGGDDPLTDLTYLSKP